MTQLDDVVEQEPVSTDKKTKLGGEVFTQPKLVNSVLVINALNGVFPLVLKKKYPSAKITCAEVFPFYKSHLRGLGFEVVDWETMGDMKFDLVIGNPPYQKDNNSGRDDDSLWPKFLARAHELVDQDGYIAFVTPASWGSLGSNPAEPGSSIRKKYLDTCQVLYVDMTCKKHFSVASSFSTYILKKTKPDPVKETKFVFADGEVMAPFDRQPCFPLNYSNSLFGDIIHDFRSKSPYQMIAEDPYTVARSSMIKKQSSGEYSDINTPQHPYRCYHTNSQTHKWSRYKNSFHDQWKAVFSYSGSWKVEVTNNCSLTDASMCVLCDSQEQAQSVKSVLESAPIRFLIDKVYRWSGYYSGSFIRMIPALPMDKIYTDDDVYDLLFTPAQSSLIKSLITVKQSS